MQHAKTFVKVPPSARLSMPAVKPEVRGQASDVSGEAGAAAAAAPSPDLTSDLRPLTSCPPAPDPDEREADRLDDAMRCPDRRRVLQTLCVGGRATGTTLCRVLRLSDKAVNRHLRDLRRFHLVHRRPREGQHVWYECDPARVHFARDDQGRDVLTLRHPSGAEVTRKVPAATPASPAEPTGVPPEIAGSE